MAGAELLRHLRLLSLQLVQLHLELLDERVVEDGREGVDRRAIGLNVSDLVYIDCFSMRSVRARVTAAFRSGESLHDDVLPIFDGHGAGPLAVLLQCLLALLDDLTLLGWCAR